MKNLKQKCLRVLGVGALMMSLCVPVMAATETIGTYGLCRACTKCQYGTVHTYTTRKYEHDEKFTCTHGGNGYDAYKVYEVTVRNSCDTCAYSDTGSYHVHELSACPAK